MKPDYSTNDPLGWCGSPARGAALGRATIQDAPKDQPIKLYLRRVQINSGGYDRNGTYFGCADPLYWCADESGDVDFMLRATTRQAARAEILENYPLARFFK